MIGVDLNAAGNEGSPPRLAATMALSGESHFHATRSCFTLSRVIWSSGAYLVLPASPPYVGHCPVPAPRWATKACVDSRATANAVSGRRRCIRPPVYFGEYGPDRDALLCRSRPEWPLL